MRKKESEPKEELIKECCFCEHSTPIEGQDCVLCERKGLVKSGYVCRKFVYDPLKRKPHPAPPLPDLSAEDFEL